MLSTQLHCQGQGRRTRNLPSSSHLVICNTDFAHRPRHQLRLVVHMSAGIATLHGEVRHRVGGTLSMASGSDLVTCTAVSNKWTVGRGTGSRDTDRGIMGAQHGVLDQGHVQGGRGLAGALRSTFFFGAAMLLGGAAGTQTPECLILSVCSLAVDLEEGGDDALGCNPLMGSAASMTWTLFMAPPLNGLHRECQKAAGAYSTVGSSFALHANANSWQLTTPLCCKLLLPFMRGAQEQSI